MPKHVLYMHPVSQPSRAVVWYIKQNGIKDIEIKEVDIFKGENKSEEITALNPFQAVPFLRVDDETIVESGAILTYLAALAGEKAGDAFAQARLQEALLLHDTMVRNISSKWVLPVVVPKALGMKLTLEQAKGAIQSSAADIKWVFDWTEKRLAKTGTITGGDSFTIADYLLACEVTQWPSFAALLPEELQLSKYPNIEKFAEGLKTKDGYAEFVAPVAMITGLVAAPFSEE